MPKGLENLTMGHRRSRAAASSPEQMEAMALRSGKALSGLPPALAAQAEQIRVCARDGEAAQLAALLDALAAGSLTGGALQPLRPFLQLHVPPLVQLQACARGWHARRRWREAVGASMRLQAAAREQLQAAEAARQRRSSRSA